MSKKELVQHALRYNDVPVQSLTVQEEKRLEQLENVVVVNFKSFIQLGAALAEIRDRKLYRNKAKTFEKYCKELFDIAKSRAYELIGAAEVIENVRNCGQNDGLDPSEFFVNESQLRPLTRLRKEQQLPVCLAAIQSAPNGKITASHVKKVVKEYIGEKIETRARKAQEKVNSVSSAEFSKAFITFSQQIIKERNSNYKYTSRNEILKALDQLRAEIAEDGDVIDESVFHGGSSDMNKLEKAGFSLFRMDRTSMTIKRRSETGSWKKEAGPFDTVKEMEAAFKAIMQDNMHLRG